LIHGLAMSTALHLAWRVPSFEDLHLQPSIATALRDLGWNPDDPLAKDAGPTAARGHNLVAVTPPMPAYAAPGLAGMINRLEPGRRGLVLAPGPQLEEWGALAHLLARGGTARVEVARGTARAMRRLRAESLDLLVTTPETALGLITRSALPMESVGSLLLAWPEMLLDEEAITPLMQDLPKQAQRLVYTSEADRTPALLERYARKALTVGTGTDMASPEPVRTVATSWSGRIRALGELIELLDPPALAVWTADRHYHSAIAEVADSHSGLELTTADAPPGVTVIAFDLPSGVRLQQLRSAGEVVLLVPPGTEAYVARIAARPRPLLLPGPVDELRSGEAAKRAAIVQAIENAQSNRALLTLAPLFERHDPTLVAAALYRLWSESAPAAAPVAPAAPAAAQPTARIWVGLGKKDGANPNELVAVLTKELRVDRSKIGRIELRDAYSLIELPAQEAEPVASALNGRTIRRKRVLARVDRGPSRSSLSASGSPGRARRG
jgi:ATP-dependent RNA helicase DeaD